MRSRRLALPPSLRIDAQLEMLSSKTPQGTVLAGTTSVYLYQAQQDPRTMVVDNRTRSVGLKEVSGAGARKFPSSPI